VTHKKTLALMFAALFATAVIAAAVITQRIVLIGLLGLIATFLYPFRQRKSPR
jgi:4-hydroxybenzoate polyprenyltransferase